jgi:hypothetical protein
VLRIGAAFDRGDPGLLRFFAGLLARVDQPERAESLEVVLGRRRIIFWFS